MADSIVKALDTQIAELEAQIEALTNARAALGGRTSGRAHRGARRRRRRKLSAAQRAAISKRMKAAWARRKAGQK